MTDLRERLRSRKAFFRNGAAWLISGEPDPDCAEAADEIERLTRERDKLCHDIDLLVRTCGEQATRIERLRAALQQIAASGLGVFGQQEVASAALEQSVDHDKLRKEVQEQFPKTLDYLKDH